MLRCFFNYRFSLIKKIYFYDYDYNEQLLQRSHPTVNRAWRIIKTLRKKENSTNDEIIEGFLKIEFSKIIQFKLVNYS